MKERDLLPPEIEALYNNGDAPTNEADTATNGLDATAASLANGDAPTDEADAATPEPVAQSD